jgi:hypothetical protein
MEHMICNEIREIDVEFPKYDPAGPSRIVSYLQGIGDAIPSDAVVSMQLLG